MERHSEQEAVASRIKTGRWDQFDESCRDFSFVRSLPVRIRADLHRADFGLKLSLHGYGPSTWTINDEADTDFVVLSLSAAFRSVQSGV